MPGKPPVEYRITLCKKEQGGLPVITPHTIGKHTYDKVAEVLYKAMKGKRQR